jgi:GTP cyclohydrolase II
MNIKVSNIAKLPTKFGDFEIQCFKEGEKEHLVIKTKNLDEIVNVRIHSECLTGDTLGSLKCDCGEQLAFSLNYIAQHNGMVLYLRQEGRNIGLFNKVNAYALQDQGLDTVEANHQLGFLADERTYEIVDFIFDYYKIDKINILTNNPEKLKSLKAKIINRIPIIVGKNPQNELYLQIKKTKMGHLL